MTLCPPIQDRLSGILEKQLRFDETDVHASFKSFELSSHFQPIYSLPRQRPVGHEALLRAHTAANHPVPPTELFGALNHSEKFQLDCLSQLLHLHNFQNQSNREQWLFLNMTPEVFLQARFAPKGQSFADQLEHIGFPAHLLVIEVLEEAVRDMKEFASAVAFFREIGCLIALDDFGAGSSNFDRVWRISPQIVKLDRSLIAQAGSEKHVRRVLPQLVSLLHEAGAMVLIEGIETEEEAYLALNADADFAQGYLFGRPQAQLAEQHVPHAAIDKAWKQFDKQASLERKQKKQAMAPYINAIGYASTLLCAGYPLPEACSSFLELPDTSFCYLLDEHGRQVGFNLRNSRLSTTFDPRLTPLRDSRNARWSRRPYYRRALECFGKVQVTRPYFSSICGDLCVTVSISFKSKGQTLVLCGDVLWKQALEQ